MVEEWSDTVPDGIPEESSQENGTERMWPMPPFLSIPFSPLLKHYNQFHLPSISIAHEWRN